MLDALPLVELTAVAEHAEVLAHEGEHPGQLRHLPRDGVIRRWGDDILMALDLHLWPHARGVQVGIDSGDLHYPVPVGQIRRAKEKAPQCEAVKNWGREPSGLSSLTAASVRVLPR